MTPKDIKRVLTLRRKGYATNDIAKLTGLSAYAVGQIQLPEKKKKSTRQLKEPRVVPDLQFPGFEEGPGGYVMIYCPSCGATVRKPCLVCWLRNTAPILPKASHLMELSDLEAREILKADLSDECLSRYTDIQQHKLRGLSPDECINGEKCYEWYRKE